MQTVVLVACCGQKLEGRHPAKDLYQSQLFKKARAWAEKNGDRWFILSAKYGLVAPDEEIDEYDVTLNDATKEYRKDWAERIAAQLTPFAGCKLVVLAGKNYCQDWPERFVNVDRPMKGLGIGKQLGWLTGQALLAGDLSR